MNSRAPLQYSLMLAPLIGATGSVTTALGLCLMFFLVIGAFGLGMAVVRRWLNPATHTLASIVLAATLTSCAQFAAQAWSLQWHQSLGIYAGLIALQCIVLNHTGFFQRAWRDCLRLCALFVVLMTGLGLLRETLGNSGFHLAVLAPGGFILLGLMIATWQACTPLTNKH
ncbi:Rnf-Nqr domain containing protein [Rhodococcus sp. IEGM1300]